MPRHLKAMKDVASCDKLRVGASIQKSGDFRMGQPNNRKRRTQGTETSKYLEEKKTIVIPQVVASERGEAQTVVVKATTGL